MYFKIKNSFLKVLSLSCFITLLFILKGCDYLPKQSIVMLNEKQKLELVNGVYDADTSIINLFKQHNIVAIGDAHFYDEVMSYITKLVTNGEFSENCQHIVVEFGNGKYQSIIDDYVSGKTVDKNQLKKVWQDTLFFTAWTPAVYANFFTVVRNHNLQQPAAKQLKITLAESPFDWQDIKEQSQWQVLADSKVIGFHNQITKAVPPDDKALLIFGAFHTIKLTQSIQAAVQKTQSPLLTRLQNSGYSTYAIWPIIQQDLMTTLATNNSSTKPGFIDVKSSALSNLEFADIFPKARIKLSELNARNAKVNELFDGLLYLGTIQRNMTFPAPLLHDDEFIEVAKKRVALIGGRVESKFNDILAISKEQTD